MTSCKLLTGLVVLLCSTIMATAQSDVWQEFEATEQNPFGLKNPAAPEQLGDFEPMIGVCDCKSSRRGPDGVWADTTDKVWQFEYTLNGTAIQDHTWAQGFFATSIRQFHVDSNKWVVNYSSYPLVSTTGGVWLGGKVGDDIVLNKPQKAPNGMDGFSRLTFTNISKSGFDWRGEWVNEEQGIVYPFWKIWCEKRE